MSVVDCICVAEVTGETLVRLAVRGNALIESCGLRYPVKCTLFGSYAERLATWVLGERDEETVYGYDSMAERWARSTGGVTLVLEDSEGQAAEVALIVVGQCEELQSQ
jgi:hypothetical protein